MEMGAVALQDGSVIFRVWAPKANKVSVKISAPIEKIVPMRPEGGGIFSAKVLNLPEGADYCYVLDDAKERPDPCSRYQPKGVHGPSRVVDPKGFKWTDGKWKGIPLAELIIYELHVGIFTEEGTFEAIISKLPYLVDLGVTAIELMPVAQFSGGRNWGYDGVFPYAPQCTYGGPEGLRKLVDACHNTGLAVVLDVVYNHIGPEGACLNDFGHYFTSRYHTPWGDAINFDDAESDPVREYFISNAIYWMKEFHIDALRMDAIDRIYDQSPKHILQELGERFHAEAAAFGRKAWLIAESDLNDVRVINPIPQAGWGIDSQWNDDFHHSMHSLLVPEKHGYMADFGTVDDLAKAIAEGFVYDGKKSTFRRRKHGTSSLDCPGYRFVSALQNHDQVANYDYGKRMGEILSPDQQKLAAMILLCTPHLPLLFMGQEFGETTRFDYFTSHSDPELIEAVRKGRREEWPFKDALPDPHAVETFNKSRIHWGSLESPPHHDIFAFYRDLIAIRKTQPCLSNCRKDLMQVSWSDHPRWISIDRKDPSGSRAFVLVNLSPEHIVIDHSAGQGPWDLALWCGLEKPSQQLKPDEKIELFPWGAALYIKTHPSASLGG